MIRNVKISEEGPVLLLLYSWIMRHNRKIKKRKQSLLFQEYVFITLSLSFLFSFIGSLAC